MPVPFDYETLRVIWWVLLGVLLVGFAVLDGFDLGVAALMPWVAKTDAERRVLLNTIGPVWEGNQVWFILGGGAIFAAWPAIYAVAFSGLYLALFVVLVTLIVRPVTFKFRSKVESPAWRSTWDWILSVAGAVGALLFGVAVGNVLVGLPFRLDGDLRMTWQGGLLDLLTPFPLLAGVVSLAMLTAHGAAFIGLRTEAPIVTRANRIGGVAALVALAAFLLGGLWVAALDGQAITSAVDPGGPSNPLLKQVALVGGGWLANYARMPWTIAAPVAGAAGLLVAGLSLFAGRHVLAFLGSAAGVAGVVATAGVSTFPFILPSSLDPASGLTVWDASSSRLTLFLMLLAVAIFMPIILLYTAWAYRVIAGRVTVRSVEGGPDAIY